MDNKRDNKLNIKTAVKMTLIFTIILIIVTYSYYKSKDFIIGPSITIESPLTGTGVANPLVEVIGVASNISYISMDDRQIYTNEKGKFKEKLLLFPGYNIISIKARDMFNRTVQKTIELIYNAPVVKNSTTTSATTTPEYSVEQINSSGTSTSTSTTKDYNKLSN